MVLLTFEIGNGPYVLLQPRLNAESPSLSRHICVELKQDAGGPGGHRRIAIAAGLSHRRSLHAQSIHRLLGGVAAGIRAHADVICPLDPSHKAVLHGSGSRLGTLKIRMGPGQMDMIAAHDPRGSLWLVDVDPTWGQIEVLGLHHADLALLGLPQLDKIPVRVIISEGIAGPLNVRQVAHHHGGGIVIKPYPQRLVIHGGIRRPDRKARQKQSHDQQFRQFFSHKKLQSFARAN